jgi:riboflavin biosynthesis pyrimidine reductase
MTTLRVLLPGPAEIGDTTRDAEGLVQALADLYAYPDPTPRRGWVRASMISTLDGSATGPDGLSGSIGGPADRAVLSALRGLADVVLVGAGTARAEGYQAPVAKPAFAERRRRAHQRAAVELAVVTRSGDVPDGAVTHDSGYVITCAAADVVRLQASHGAERVIVAGTDDVEPRAAVAELADRGLRRVLLEGGPGLLGESLAAEVVDELCLTLSAVLVAGDGPRVAFGPRTHQRLTLAHLVHAGDLMLGRWLVRRDDAAGR